MIPKWFAKRRKTPEADTSKAAVVDKAWEHLARFGELVAENPSAFIDESELPCGKDTLKKCLKVAMISAHSARDEKKMEWLKTGWLMLSVFRPGIGRPPLQLELPASLADLNKEIANRYFAVQKDAESEDKNNFSEMSEFLQELSN